MSGRWGRKRKMGYEGASSASRRRVDGRVTKGGVEFTHNALTDQVTCTMCGARGAAQDLAYMLEHAAVHRPRVAALELIGELLGPLGDEVLVAVALVLPAVAANPAGFAAVASALASGATKHPGRGLGPSPDQSVGDHLAALGRHARLAPWQDGAHRPGLATDDDTDLPHASLAAARGVLAVQAAADRPAAEAERQARDPLRTP